MEKGPIDLRDIKSLRLARHWSQDQLAQMSGLSVRTIQRIENGENAGLESLKSLGAVFERNVVDSDKKIEIDQARKAEAYVQNVKSFYKLLAIALLSLAVPLVLAVSDAANWSVFLWLLLSWAVVLGVYSLNVFEFFGENWKRELIEKRFKKK